MCVRIYLFIKLSSYRFISKFTCGIKNFTIDSKVIHCTIALIRIGIIKISASRSILTRLTGTVINL